jgi:hypothetical protein
MKICGNGEGAYSGNKRTLLATSLVILSLFRAPSLADGCRGNFSTMVGSNLFGAF